MTKKQMNPLDKLFAEAKTMAESRKAREKKTSHNILHVKRKIEDSMEKAFVGSLQRSYMLAITINERCSSCGHEQERVSRLSIVSKSTLNGTERETMQVSGQVIYDFNQDLPIRIRRGETSVIVCVECLLEDQAKRNRNHAKEAHEAQDDSARPRAASAG